MTRPLKDRTGTGTTGIVADFLVALYPGRWRCRYEEEYRGVLEQCPLTPFIVADVIRGAIQAHRAYRPEVRAAAVRRRHARCQVVAALVFRISLSALRLRPRTASPYRPLRGILC